MDRGPAQICGEKNCKDFCRWPDCMKPVTEDE